MKAQQALQQRLNDPPQQSTLPHATGDHLSEHQRQRILQHQNDFLVSFAQCGTISKAVIPAGISRFSVTYWLKFDVLGFKERFSAAWEDFREEMQSLAVEKVRRMDSKDNILHIALLNGIWPERYKRDSGGSSDSRAVDLLAEMRRMFRESAKPSGDGATTEEMALFSTGETSIAMMRRESGPPLPEEEADASDSGA